MAFEHLRKETIIILYHDSLFHYGVKGQKWGIRRYQNEDGSLTSDGKRRLERDIRESNGSKKIPDPNRWVREDISRSKNVLDSTKQAVDNTRNLTKSINNVKKQNKSIDLSNMSDQELRNVINRRLLEKQYNDLMFPETMSKGKKRLDQVLEIGGTSLALASSALGIALAIKQLRGK